MKITSNLAWEQWDGAGTGPEFGEITEAMARIAGKDPEYWAGVLTGAVLTSWDEQGQHMRELSDMWPDTLFSLTCEDEGGNAWRTYARGGRIQEVDGEMVFPPFDPDALA